MPGRLKTMLGIAFISMAVLANEIILTRIFSVTLWYHFAFLVISLALLGSGAAGVWLFLFPRPFEGERAPKMLPWLARGYALSIFIVFLIYQEIPLTVDDLREGLGSREIAYLALIYIMFTIPFIFAGGTIALALKHYQAEAGRLYFADLTGASLGCVVSVLALNALGGAGGIVLVMMLGALSAFLLSLDSGENLTQVIMSEFLLIAIIAIGLQINGEWLKLDPKKTYNNDEPIYEAWNAFSRITLYEDPSPIPFGWGISQTFYDERTEEERRDPGHYTILIDEKAGTPIQKHNWNGGDEDFESVEFLRYDLTALPYYLRDDFGVFIIGPGGGRDVLTAIVFGARQITGVELNPIIFDLVKYDYAEYAGHIYSRPHVDIHVDDARTFLAATDDHYDIIQASLIDTFAASSAGAFALSENGIYTVEAFEVYYEHLNDDGMVNFSRWYYAPGPAETLRLVSVGLKAWENEGIEDVTQHIAVIANLTSRIKDEGLAGMLLKKTPFTDNEIAELSRLAERYEFEVLYLPGISTADDNEVAEFILAGSREQFIKDYPLDISPTTDNRPFFFSVVRPGDLGKDEYEKSAVYSFGAEAMRTLLITLALTFVMAVTFIVLPLTVKKGEILKTSNIGSYIGYYAMLGLAFILVEIPMMQMLNVYLGNPTYALAVVLFALLLFSGIGSYFSQRVAADNMLHNIRLTLAALMAILVIYIILLPYLLRATQGFQLEWRALVVVLMLLPPGLLMGRPFPLGLRYVDHQGAGQVMPWLWAANGTLSVLGSVSAVLIAINFGFRLAFFVGLVAYALALGMTFLFTGTKAKSRDMAVE